MPPPSTGLPDSPQTARALPTVGLIDSPRRCPACQKPLEGRQEAACSGRCRAKLSRQRRAGEILTLLDRAEAHQLHAAEALQAARQRLEKGT